MGRAYGGVPVLCIRCGITVQVGAWPLRQRRLVECPDPSSPEWSPDTLRFEGLIEGHSIVEKPAMSEGKAILPDAGSEALS